MPHRPQKSAGSLYRMEPAIANERMAGKQEKSITCCGDLFTCRERVAGNREAEKSFSCNFARVPKARLRTLRTAHRAALFPPGSASELKLTGCKTVNAPKPVQCIDGSDLRIPSSKGTSGARSFCLRKSLFCLPVDVPASTLVCGLRVSGLAESFASGRTPFREAFC